MPGYLRFGSYNHDPQEVTLSTQQELLYTAGQTPYATLHTWTISGFLSASSDVEMNTKYEALLAAYAGTTNSNDAALILSNGTTSHLHLDASQAINGVRVVKKPSIPTLDRGGYVTQLAYTCVLEAEIPLSDPATALKFFEERVTFGGGGPLYGMLQPAVAPPVPVTLFRNTPFFARQSGRAVGAYRRPILGRIAPALWRPPILVTNPTVELDSGRRRGNVFEDFGISWSYEYISARPLIAAPNVWR